MWIALGIVSVAVLSMLVPIWRLIDKSPDSKGYSDEVVGQLMRGAMRHPDFSTCALWFDR